MVRGDQQSAAGCCDRLRNPAETGVDRLHRFDCSRQAAGVSDHVGVGVVQHDQVIAAGANCFHRPIRQLRRRHLGFEVIGCDLRRRNHDAVLAAVRLLLAAIEKIGDVRIFLRLGHAQLRAAGVADDLAEHVG